MIKMVCIPANKSVPHYVFVEEARTDVTTGGAWARRKVLCCQVEENKY